MKIRSIAFCSIAAITLGYSSTTWSKPPSEHANNKPRPQIAVECTGWHALCSLATDCAYDPETGVADCACWQVNGQHVVATSNIKNAAFGGAPIKEETQRRCTTAHPCELDEAPVCQAIKELLGYDQWTSPVTGIGAYNTSYNSYFKKYGYLKENIADSWEENWAGITP